MNNSPPPPSSQPKTNLMVFLGGGVLIVLVIVLVLVFSSRGGGSGGGGGGGGSGGGGGPPAPPSIGKPVVTNIRPTTINVRADVIDISDSTEIEFFLDPPGPTGTIIPSAPAWKLKRAIGVDISFGASLPAPSYTIYASKTSNPRIDSVHSDPFVVPFIDKPVVTNVTKTGLHVQADVRGIPSTTQLQLTFFPSLSSIITLTVAELTSEEGKDITYDGVTLVGGTDYYVYIDGFGLRSVNSDNFTIPEFDYRLVNTIPASNGVYGLSITNDGSNMAFLDYINPSKYLKLYSLNGSPTPLLTLSLSTSVIFYDLSISRDDGSVMALSDSTGVKIYKNNVLLFTIPISGNAYMVALNGDGSLLAVLYESHTIQFFTLDTISASPTSTQVGNPITSSSEISSICFNNDGSFFFWSTVDGIGSTLNISERQSTGIYNTIKTHILADYLVRKISSTSLGDILTTMTISEGGVRDVTIYRRPTPTNLQKIPINLNIANSIGLVSCNENARTLAIYDYETIKIYKSI